MTRNFVIPSEFQFLLKENNINSKTVKKSRSLKYIFSSVPKTIKNRIRRNIAVISLYYADDYIRSQSPLFANAMLNKLKLTVLRTKNDKTEYKFDAEVLTPQCEQNENNKPIELKEYVVLKVDDEEILQGKVYKSSDDCFKMKGYIFSTKSKPLPAENLAVDVHAKLVDFIPAAISKAINRIEEGMLNDVIMPNPHLRKLKKYRKGLESALEEFFEDFPGYPNLNLQQKSAVYAMTRGLHKPNAFVLFGPPGTGKTVTIVSAVLQSLREDEKNRILICTPSNTAADRVAKELLKYIGNELIGHDDVLRMCSLSVDFEHRDKSLDCISNVGPVEYRLITNFRKYRVIITTLASSVRLFGEKFTHIMVDEAGQALEAELWIPLGCCADSDTAVSFCGDPNQLGPLNKLNFPQHYSNYLECPLNLYLNLAGYSSDPRLCVRLVDCYRCHKSIVRIASQLFYNCELNNAGDKKWLKELCKNPSWFNMGFPIMFIDAHKGCHKQGPHGKSIGNEKEVKLVCRVLKYLNNDLDVAFDKIGVVSPYKYHTKLIREKVLEKFNRKVSKKLTVDSVERFQGSEREVIIITTARTEGLGFLSCDLRLNTAITRAQRLLIVIGHRSTLQEHGNWRRFINYVDDHNAVYKRLPRRKPLADITDGFAKLRIEDDE